MIDIMFVSISKKQKKEEEDIMFVPYPKNVKRCHRKTYINYILNLIINSFNLNPNCFSDPWLWSYSITSRQHNLFIQVITFLSNNKLLVGLVGFFVLEVWIQQFFLLLCLPCMDSILKNWNKLSLTEIEGVGISLNRGTNGSKVILSAKFLPKCNFNMTPLAEPLALCGGPVESSM